MKSHSKSKWKKYGFDDFHLFHLPLTKYQFVSKTEALSLIYKIVSLIDLIVSQT